MSVDIGHIRPLPQGQSNPLVDAAEARRAMLCGTMAGSWAFGPRPARFFDLSEEVTVLPETVNSLFTRGFQPMLNSSTVDMLASDAPLSDGEKME